MQIFIQLSPTLTKLCQGGHLLSRSWNSCTGCQSASGSTTSWPFWHKIRATSTPSYLSDHIRPRETARQLRSSTMPLLHRPTTRTHFADSAFRCCAPSVWNLLDSETLHCSFFSGFKRRLKTLLFHQTFSSTTWTVRQRLWSHPTCWRYINKIIIYVAAKATYIRLLHGKIVFWVFFGPSSVKRGRTHIVLGRNM